MSVEEINGTIDHNDPVFRTWLRDMLSCTVVTVTFKKSDGTDRVMKCTLDSTRGVVEYERKTDRVKNKNPDTLAVWDIEKNEWRSFRWDALKNVVVELTSET